MTSSANDDRKIPFQLPQPTGMVADIVVTGALDLDGDEQEWVPQFEDVAFKPLVLNVTAGYYVNLLRVRASGVLSRHRHSGPVHAFTLRGEWHYLEHDWIAKTGDYVFEPPGETHTLVVPDHVTEMITLFHVTGGYTYVDPSGNALGYEDVFTKLAHARAHYERLGLGAEHAADSSGERDGITPTGPDGLGAFAIRAMRPERRGLDGPCTGALPGRTVPARGPAPVAFPLRAD